MISPLSLRNSKSQDSIFLHQSDHKFNSPLEESISKYLNIALKRICQDDSKNSFSKKCFCCSLKKPQTNFDEKIKQKYKRTQSPKKRLDKVFRHLFKLMKPTNKQKMVLSSKNFESMFLNRDS